MANVITETWLAYAFGGPAPLERVRGALARVGAHYGPQLEAPPPLRESAGELTGLALWRNDDAESRWPAWAEGGGLVAGSMGAPAGWERIVGDLAPGTRRCPSRGPSARIRSGPASSRLPSWSGFASRLPSG